MSLTELCRELFLLRAAHAKYFKQRKTMDDGELPACLVEYEERRAADSAFMATISDFRVDCAVKYGQMLAARFALEDIKRKTQEHEAVRAMVELRGTPYTGPTQQSERNKIET